MVFNYGQDPIIEIGAEFFFAVYCSELVVKLIAYGFVFDPHSFLRNGHSVVELTVIVSNMLPMFFPVATMFKQLRVIRVVRLFRLIGTLKFTRKIMNALVSSIKDLVPVFLLFLAIVSFFSLVSLVFYRGTLLGKCVEMNYEAIFENATDEVDTSSREKVATMSQHLYARFKAWTDNTSNWNEESYGVRRCPVITRTSNWWMTLIDDRHLRKCNSTFRCIQTSTGNPNMGFSNYDTLMLSMLSTFRLLCQDWWDNMYVTVTLANGGHATTLFFLVLIFLGSHYVINLVLSTITLSYQRNEPNEENDEEELAKLAVILHINRDNQLRREVEIYNVLLDQGRTGLVEPSFLQNLPDTPVGKSPQVEAYLADFVATYRFSQGGLSGTGSNNTDPSAAIAAADTQPTEFLGSLDGFLRSIVVRDGSGEGLPSDMLVNFIILLNVIEMLVVTPVQKQATQVVEGTNLLYTMIFTVEALLKIRYQRMYYLRSMINRFDLLIVVICLVEMMLPMNHRIAMTLRMMRFLRLFKLARVSKQLEKLITIMLQSIQSELPLIVLSFTIVIISAGIGMVMFQDTYNKPENKQYQKPTQNFVDIYNSILLVFRIMCGEWIENLWVCMKIMESRPEKGFCVVYFLTNQIIVSLVIFQLYIGILLSKFSEFRSKTIEEEQKEVVDEATTAEAKKPRMKSRIKNCLTNCCGVEFDSADRSSSVQVEDSAFLRFRAHLSGIASNSSSWFAKYIIVMIVFSSTALVLEDYYLSNDKGLKMICDHLDIIFLVVFGFEVMIKMIAYGPCEYIRSFWRILDLTVVVVSLVDIVLKIFITSQVNLAMLRVLRTLRCLRILRTASVWDGFKLTISALFHSVRRLFFAFVIVIIVWLMFALVSTSLFSHKFYRCVVSEQNDAVISKTIINNKNACLHANHTWKNKRINFDTTPAAMLALLEISVFKGWIDIFQDISNAPDTVDLQPDIDNNSSPYVLIYIFFIILGSFFMIGMLIGVIVDSFEEERSKLAKVVITDGQRRLQSALKQYLMFPLNSNKPMPDGWLCRCLYKINKAIYVEVFYLVLIMASTVVMALQYHPGKSQLQTYLGVADDVILLFFVLELVMKILAEGPYYLVPMLSWNLADFIIVMLSVVSRVCDEAIDLQYLRVTRFARVFRMGRLLARSTNIKTVRDILLVMVTTLPSMLNMIALLIMAICIFSIVGVNLFSDQEGNDEHPFNEMFSFRTFVSTWRMLFIVSTAAGFNDYLDGTMKFPWPYGALGIAFWVSYLCLSFFVLTNLIVSAVVSSYNEVFDNESSNVRLQTAETFTNMWNDFDQRGTGRMHARHISELLDLLSEPLRVPQPNAGVVSYMEIPLTEDYQVRHSDMVRALVKELMEEMGLIDLSNEGGEGKRQDTALLNTRLLHHLRMAANGVKTAWWQRKLRHAMARLKGDGK